jgi:hypothetical protein
VKKKYKNDEAIALPRKKFIFIQNSARFGSLEAVKSPTLIVHKVTMDIVKAKALEEGLLLPRNITRARLPISTAAVQMITTYADITTPFIISR